jgi:hypothetical protein
LLVVSPGLGHLSICVSGVAFEDRIDGIDDDPEFRFLHDQDQERDDDAGDEVQERAGGGISGKTSPPL